MARLIDRYTLTANAAYRGEVNPPLAEKENGNDGLQEHV